MRALTVDEVGLISGGVETDGDGRPVWTSGRGWDNYRDPIKGTNTNPFAGITEPGFFAGLGNKVEAAINDPAGTIGDLIALADIPLDQSRQAYHNQMVKIVGRDRNNDGRTTDAERQANWDEYQRWLQSQRR